MKPFVVCYLQYFFNKKYSNLQNFIENITLHGYFKCAFSQIHIHLSSVCDSQIDCPNGMDELFCIEKQQCPQNCICLSIIYIICDFTQNLSKTVKIDQEKVAKHVHLSNVKNINEILLKFEYLTINSLNLSFNQNISIKILKKVKNLVILDLAHNNIENIHLTFFGNLKMLQILDLHSNRLGDITHNIKLLKFPIYIDLSEMKLSLPSSNTFGKNLRILKMNNCTISSIFQNTFKNSEFVENASFKNTKFSKDISFSFYKYLKNLKYLEIEEHSACCSANRYSKKMYSCSLSSNLLFEQSKCLNLLSYLQKLFIIFCICVTFLGNIFSILFSFMDIKNKNTFFLINLNIYDILMTIYLILILIQDFIYENEFQENSIRFRYSWTCFFTGIIACISFLGSVSTVLIMTVFRYLTVINPLSTPKLNVPLILVMNSVIVVILVFTPVIFHKVSFCKEYSS